MHLLVWFGVIWCKAVLCYVVFFPFPKCSQKIRIQPAYNPSQGLYQDFRQLSSLPYHPSVVRQIFNCSVVMWAANVELFETTCNTAHESTFSSERSYFQRLVWPECQRSNFIIKILDCYGAVSLPDCQLSFFHPPCLFSTRGKRWTEPFVLAMWHTKERKFEFWSICIT